MHNHGDVHVWSVDAIPADATSRENRVVREGEATGHAHRVEGDAELFELGERIFARIAEGNTATITHEEHKPITLGPGTYEFGPTYEYDYDAEEAAIVAD